MSKYTKYNQAALLFHAVIDNLDNSHFVYDEKLGELKFNVGKVARNASFSHINIYVIGSNDKEQYIKPAKLKNGSGEFAVVVRDKDFPSSIKEVDKFLESSNRSMDIIKALAEIIRVSPANDTATGSSSTKTKYEKEKYYNDRDTFEKMYQEGVKKMQEKIESFKSSSKELEDKIENTGISSRKATYEMAIKNLKNDIIGDGISKFKSNFMKVLDEIDSEFKNHLNSDNKKRLNSRIEQFYSEIA